jgi:hypothetical protein
MSTTVNIYENTGKKVITAVDDGHGTLAIWQVNATEAALFVSLFGSYFYLENNSRDVIHSFWVPALHGKVDLIPGHPNFIRIEASHPGSYAGECAVFCGAQHAHRRQGQFAKRRLTEAP